MNALDEETPIAGIILQPEGAGDVTTVPVWQSLVLTQRADELTAQKLFDSKHGSVIALEDRNVMSMPWRKIYIVRDNDNFVLFDSDGWLIDEPSSGVTGGRQPVQELVHEFSEEPIYYRVASVRKTPTARQPQSSSRTFSAAQLAAEEHPPEGATSASTAITGEANLMDEQPSTQSQSDSAVRQSTAADQAGSALSNSISITTEIPVATVDGTTSLSQHSLSPVAW